MPEGERLSTLEGLEQTKKEVNAELAAQRISADNISALKRKDNLEAKIVDLNRAVEIFSKKTVYVQANK